MAQLPNSRDHAKCGSVRAWMASAPRARAQLGSRRDKRGAAPGTHRWRVARRTRKAEPRNEVVAVRHMCRGRRPIRSGTAAAAWPATCRSSPDWGAERAIRRRLPSWGADTIAEKRPGLRQGGCTSQIVRRGRHARPSPDVRIEPVEGVAASLQSVGCSLWRSRTSRCLRARP